MEEQRESLYSTVDTISRAVSVRRSRFEKLRTRTPILVAAALLAVSALAASVAALTLMDQPSPAQARLQQAERIADPAARLTAIVDTYRDVARTDPASIAPGTALNHDVTKALTKTSTDMQNDPTKSQLVIQARAWIDAISHGQPPPAPQGTPSPPPAPGGSTPTGIPPILPNS